MNIEGTFSLQRRKVDIKKVNKDISIRRTNNPPYSLVLQANKIFNEYFSSITKKCDQKSILNIIYKMELTGALIILKHIPCLVVEERKNSLIVVYEDDSIKTHIKKDLVFYLEKDGVRYGIVGSTLKVNRFIRK